MTEVEEAIPLPQILKMLGWSERKYHQKRPELVRMGVVFKRREGRPYIVRTYAFPSRITTAISMTVRFIAPECMLTSYGPIAAEDPYPTAL